MSQHPELNSKIRLMSALAPITYVEHMSSPIALIAPFCNQIEVLLDFYINIQCIAQNATFTAFLAHLKHAIHDAHFVMFPNHEKWD